MNTTPRLTIHAPGKIVLWGEYAVLNGAPAAVMAVDRMARFEVQPTTQHIHLSGEGFMTPAAYKATDTFCALPVAALVEAMFHTLGFDHYPLRFAARSSTTEFYTQGGEKLGIGSSAALCCATYFGLCQLLSRTPTETEAIAIHQHFQGGRGSGLDVAASWHGGTIRFENGCGHPWQWPTELFWKAIWTRTSAPTFGALGSFNLWRQSNDSQLLDDLGTLSKTLFTQPTLNMLQDYCAQLEALDQHAELNIYTLEHQRLMHIAAAHGLVYKPCGAGGGDIGLACGEDPDALEAFAEAAASDNFVPLELETASHGVQSG
jgi:phosphomevalonate kinase